MCAACLFLLACLRVEDRKDELFGAFCHGTVQFGAAIPAFLTMHTVPICLQEPKIIAPAAVGAIRSNELSAQP